LWSLAQTSSITGPPPGRPAERFEPDEVAVAVVLAQVDVGGEHAVCLGEELAQIAEGDRLRQVEVDLDGQRHGGEA